MPPVSRKHRWQRAIADSTLPPRARLIAHTMSMYAKPDGSMQRHPSIRRLMKATGQARNTVRAGIQDLIDGHWIAPIGHDTWGATAYWLTIPIDSPHHDKGGQPLTPGGVNHGPRSDQPLTPHPSGTGSSSPDRVLTNVVALTSNALRMPR